MRVKKQVPFFTLFVLSAFATDGSSAFFVHDTTTTTTITTKTYFYKSSTRRRQSMPYCCDRPGRSLIRLNVDSANKEAEENDGDGGGIEQELERLQDQLQYIEAIEARNKAQLDSFVDEEDQWNSMDEEERELLKSKDAIQQKMELLTEQLVMLWMGQKSQDG